MNQVFRIGLWVCLVYWLVPAGTAMQPAQKQIGKESAARSFQRVDEGSIRMPEQPPLYLFNQEAFSADLITESARYSFLFLLIGRLTPRDFDFQKKIHLTFHQIVHEAIVPVYIRGHALLC
jgi:hypothetical protein